MAKSAYNRLLAQNMEGKDKGYKTEHVPSLAELEAEVDRIDAKNKAKKEAKEKKDKPTTKDNLRKLRDKSREAIEKAGA